MRRQKPVQPIYLLSPEQDLCEISMQIDQNELTNSNYKTPYIGTNKQHRFDGWVKLESKNEEKMIKYRSHIIENINKSIKQEEATQRYLSSRYHHKRGSSNQENINALKRSRDDLEMTKAQSQDYSNEGSSFAEQDAKEMYHSANFNENLMNIRRNMANTREANRSDRQIYSKVQVGAVTYPILQLQVNDPEKKYLFHIGRVRRLINTNKSKKK